jgi:hypothetical protein
VSFRKTCKFFEKKLKGSRSKAVKIGKEVMFSVKQIVSPVSSSKLDSALMIFLID